MRDYILQSAFHKCRTIGWNRRHDIRKYEKWYTDVNTKFFFNHSSFKHRHPSATSLQALGHTTFCRTAVSMLAWPWISIRMSGVKCFCPSPCAHLILTPGKPVLEGILHLWASDSALCQLSLCHYSFNSYNCISVTWLGHEETAWVYARGLFKRTIIILMPILTITMNINMPGHILVSTEWLFDEFLVWRIRHGSGNLMELAEVAPSAPTALPYKALWTDGYNLCLSILAFNIRPVICFFSGEGPAEVRGQGPRIY